MSYANTIGMKILLWAIGKFYSRPKFGKFLQLENTKNKIFQAVKRKDKEVPDLVISYISTAFLFPRAIIEKFRWDLSFSLFILGVGKSVPSNKLPLLKPHTSNEKKDAWDYEDRVQHLYVHILAKSYGWTDKYINNLDVDTAMALVQEVITDEQLDREFMWAIGDKSYIYDAKTKSGRPNPLDRPYFMREPIEVPKKVSMPASMLPPGVDYSSIPPEFRPK